MSASRWSAQPPLGDDSSSSESVSQSSILPEADLEQPVQVRQPVAPLVWALIVLALFLAALIGVIVVARSIRPWIDARKQGTIDLRMPLDEGILQNELRRNEAALSRRFTGGLAGVTIMFRREACNPRHQPAIRRV